MTAENPTKKEKARYRKLWNMEASALLLAAIPIRAKLEELRAKGISQLGLDDIAFIRATNMEEFYTREKVCEKMGGKQRLCEFCPLTHTSWEAFAYGGCPTDGDPEPGDPRVDDSHLFVG
jgi:hypothetical protein